MTQLKEFDYKDFENDKDGLIEFLLSYHDFDKLEVKKIDEKLNKNDQYVKIEKDHIDIHRIKETFKNVEFIDDEDILYNVHLVIS